MNNKENTGFSVMRTVSDRAVMQHGCVNTVYGHAPAYSVVALTISGNGTGATLTAAADADGNWKIDIPAFKGSLKPYTFTFLCGDITLEFTDIYFGELFHISGQSNMELPMYRTVSPFDMEEFPVCEYIREFRVPIVCCFGKDEEYEDFPGGEWLTADSVNVPEMSAAGYYFALEIYKRYRMPVGLLNTSAGGAPVEARMPYSMLSEFGWHDEFLKKCTAEGYMRETATADAMRNEQREAELKRLDGISDTVLGGGGEFTGCTLPADLKDIPGLSGFCGHIWFRKDFDIPEGTDINGAVLILGTLTDADRTYLNGTLTGETCYMYPPRYYYVPENVLKHGKNTLLVRLDVRYGCGGFTKGKRYCLKLPDRVIDLSGEWGYAVAAAVACMKRETFFQGLPLSMYGALTAPAFRIKCRALIWYQGESDCSHPDRYTFLFRKFVEMYRERCGYEIPVITTQLCNFDDPFAGGSDCWAELRQAQLGCLGIPATDMAVTIDLGESNDLHPMNKKGVGSRLALCARRTLYGDGSVPRDVFCTRAEISGSSILLRFTDNSRVILSDTSGKGFDIVTGEGVFPALSAKMTDSGLLLGFRSGVIPVKVRCEWRNDPPVVLYHNSGIPLSPFEINVTAHERIS